MGGQFPFFEVQGVFLEQRIPESLKRTKMIDIYLPEPIGDSKMTDFNPLVHLELEEIADIDDDSQEKIQI